MKVLAVQAITLYQRRNGRSGTTSNKKRANDGLSFGNRYTLT